MKTKVESPGRRIASNRTHSNLLSLLMAGLALRAAGAEPAGEPSSAENSAPLIKVDKSISAVPGVRMRNIEVFALVGPDQITKRDYLTLSEAMDKHLVRIDETRNVSELKIENLSGGSHVFIQAGDIVKGGQQDRVLITDLVLPPKSGQQPIGSFCVEQGRWTRRTGESAADFSKSDKQLITMMQRYAVKSAKQQSAVWTEVDKSKKALTMNAPKITGREINVEANASPSSLQLALENKDLADALKQMREELTAKLLQRSDVIGVAYAINGKLVNAEIYGSARLFAKLRNKVLEAAAAEAVTELTDDKVVPQAITEQELCAFLKTEGLSELKPSKPNAQTEWREREESKRAVFESRDADFRDATCHRNVILADESVKASVRGNPGIYNYSTRPQRGSQNAAPEQRPRRQTAQP